MKAESFSTSILVDNSAIKNVRGWWSEEIEGETDKLNAEWNYHFLDVHRCSMKIVEFVPDQKIMWEVLDNYFNFTADKEEWKGNRIIFEITKKDEKTQLKFTQIGLTPHYECFNICQNAWNTYIQKSLYNLITTGKGNPNSKSNPQTENEKIAAKREL